KKHPLFQECQTYRIELNTKLKFPTKYSNFILIGMHTYNEELKIKNWMKKRQSYGNIAITNDTCCIVKAAACYNTFLDIKKHFIIDKNTYIKFETNKPATENSFMVVFSENKKNTLNYIDVSAFLLADQNGKFDFSEEIKLIQNENITIDKEYDFTYLVPPVEDYKTAIEEYNFRMDPIKLAPLQKQIKEKDNIISTLNQEKTTLQNELNSFPIKKQRLELANLEQDLVVKKLESKKLAKSLGIKMSIINPKITFIQANSAKARIQNHLSYKLGQALITNSKSILGYIRMPYVLSYIKDKHKFEQKAYEEKIKENPNLALPPLETYPDYNEALKEKECFTYKLGEALMQANKNWYGGGYIKFIFKDVPRLKREFGKKG
ncbi:glycosyl transferase, partial [Campylobacter jejuni]